MPSERVEKFVGRLATYLRKGDFDKALVVCNKILKSEGYEADPDAVKAKLVALIQTGKLKEALVFCDKFYDESSGELTLERAYCLYRLKRYEEARDALASSKAQDPGTLHLLAQAQYRCCDFKGAAASYRRVLSSPDITVDDDVISNASAAMLYAGDAEGAIKAVAAHRKKGNRLGYDAEYNYACALVRTGDFEGALASLKTAMELGTKALVADGYSEEEVEEELAGIVVLLGFVEQRLGHTAEALQLYQRATRSACTDDATMTVAFNNLICLKGERDLFESERKSRKYTDAETLGRLTDNQKQAVLQNRVLLLLCMKQSKQCTEAMRRFAAEYPKSDFPVLAQAALLNREKKFARAEKLLNEEISARSNAGKDVTSLRLLLLKCTYSKDAIRRRLRR